MHILYGTQLSFYTRKAWASLRLLGLEVDDRQKSLMVKEEVEKAVDGYTRFPVVQCPDGGWLIDSTVIGIDLSKRFPAQALLPEDKALAALVLIVDDWMDEWFVRAGVAWRPIDPETRSWAADIAALNLLGLRRGETPPEHLAPNKQKLTAIMEKFFIGVGERIGVVEPSREAVLAFTWESLGRLDAILATSPYLAGSRPSLADCALWGFLDAALLWEPKPRAEIAARFPAIMAFHARLLALAENGGQPLGKWDSLEIVAQRLQPLLGEDALGFVPFLQKNRAALEDGSRKLMLDGAEIPARGAVEKWRKALKTILEGLSPAELARFDAVVGAWPVMAVYRA